MKVIIILSALMAVGFAHEIPLPVPVPQIKKVPIPIVKLDFTKGEDVVKHVPETVYEKVPYDKHVEIKKPVEVIKHVPVTKEVIVERPVEVIKEIPIEKVIIDKVEVPYEVIKHVEKIKHVPVEKHVEVIKQVEVIKHVPYKRYVFNKVPSKINYQVPDFVKVPYHISVAPEKDEKHSYLPSLPDPIGLVKKLLHQK
ncbi:titin-like [Uranotaenia lowii]|uniref:titin-like n=1 Tax=Uranotaenia lowii TaxID=190385 RepID=UPI002479069B|nr:titin-like [Uranotaenia lowii]